MAVYALLKVGGAMGVVWMIVSLGLGILLVVYGSRFLKKMRQLSSN